MKCTRLLLMALLLTTKISALQRNEDTIYIEVGKPVPYFEIDGISDFPLTRATPGTFKGKWLVIDFWDKYCLSCIESLPKINSLQKKYKDDLQYLLIGKEDTNKGIRKIYSKFRTAMDLQIPHAFDSSLFRRFDITTCPRIIIINPQGLVYALTNNLTDNNIADMLGGRYPHLNKVYQQNEKAPVKYTLRETDNNNDGSLLFKSVLNKWNPSITGNNNHTLTPVNGYYEVAGRNMIDLYMLAYFGQAGINKEDSLYTIVSGKPILQIRDKQNLEQSLDTMLYCYRLTVPPNRSSKNSIMQVMQQDLNNYFGYNAAIEERIMPCWKLVASRKAREKLKTRSEHKMVQGRIDTGFIMHDYPVKEIISKLIYIDLPVLDATGIKGNIDITLRYLLTTIEGVRKGLKENGLSLVKTHKKMKVLVIRDADPQQAF